MTDNKISNSYLDQLREQVRLKQMGVEAQKKQQSSGLLSLLDLIDINQKDTKKWMNQCPIPTKEEEFAVHFNVKQPQWQTLGHSGSPFL